MTESQLIDVYSTLKGARGNTRALLLFDDIKQAIIRYKPPSLAEFIEDEHFD